MSKLDTSKEDMKLLKFLGAQLPTLILIISAAAIVYGFWLIFEPAGWITAGVLGITAGVLMIKGRNDDNESP